MEVVWEIVLANSESLLWISLFWCRRGFRSLVLGNWEFYWKLPSHRLLVQSRQWKCQYNVWNLFKVNFKGTRSMSLMTSFCCLYRQLWIDFTYFFGFFIIVFDQINASWSTKQKAYYKLNFCQIATWLSTLNNLDVATIKNVLFSGKIVI